ncbi:hypothetical protein L7F22_031832 [Adiantum nelumboides]|nr:hypothetical protein [Adiantum nelumboides]
MECSPETPQASIQCFRLLASPSTSWPSLLGASVNDVLQILSVVDHLLFQECWDVCMAVLASLPWSIDEEEAIRTAISKLNMGPLSDVQERLDTSHDEKVLADLLCRMLSNISATADTKIIENDHRAAVVSWC